MAYIVLGTCEDVIRAATDKLIQARRAYRDLDLAIPSIRRRAWALSQVPGERMYVLNEEAAAPAQDFVGGSVNGRNLT